jgi:O-antigen/teichoic acid export membrane protein
MAEGTPGASFRYLIENVSASGAVQIRASVLGAVAGIASVGYLRGAEILMDPFLVVLSGVSQVAVPEASRIFHKNSHRLPHFCAILGGAQAVTAFAWGVVLLLVLPLGLGHLLLDEVWAPASTLILPVTLNVCAMSFLNAVTAGLRATGAARRSLQARLATSFAYLLLGVSGGPAASHGSRPAPIASIFTAMILRTTGLGSRCGRTRIGSVTARPTLPRVSARYW